MKLIRALPILFMCLVTKTYGLVPVTLSNPNPSIPSSIENGTTNTYIFTVTNNVPGISFPLTVSGISGIISRQTVSNDCGNQLAGGPSSCNIGIQIAPTSGSASITQTLSVDYQGRLPLTYPFNFSTSDTPTPPVSPPLFITGGTELSLVTSNDNAQTWSSPTITNSPPDGQFNGATCSGNGSTALCVMAGISYTAPNPPLIVQSSDGGSSWAVKTGITNFPTVGVLNGASCTRSGTPICIAVGRNATDPLLVKTLDGGANWAVQNVAGTASAGRYDGAYCKGSGSTAFCAAFGNLTGTTPLLAVSTDGAVTWNQITTNLPVSRSINSIACNGGTSSTICVGAGGVGTTPWIIRTGDGTNWSTVSTTLPASSTLVSTACTEDSAGVCAMVGRNNTSNAGLIVVTEDGGLNWSTPSGLPANGRFNTVSCTGSGSDAICIAAGTYSGDNSFTPLIYVRTSSSIWLPRSISGTGSDQIEFFGSSCSGSGTTAICIATGFNYTAPTFSYALAKSTDGGATWSMQTLSGLSSSEYFLTAASTSSS